MDHSHTTNGILLNYIKTNNPVVDAIMMTVLLTAISNLFSYFDKINIRQFFDWIINFRIFTNKNMIEYEGKISSKTCIYDSSLQQTACFSNNFKALWKHIMDTVETNPTIYSIREHNMSKNPDADVKGQSSMYVVDQSNDFLIDADLKIYANAYNVVDTEEDTKTNKTGNKYSAKLERIIIQLYSKESSISVMKKYVDNITEKHLASINSFRQNKQYIYTLSQMKVEDDSYERWQETRFESTRSFANLFFENKGRVCAKIDHFLKNKEWYFNKGIPYTLGIGLHGPPGTGKTSFIKAIANYTKRHIVSISLKMIKTKKQLDAVFFEERYNEQNLKGSITFDKKIIVFEDIDCIGDIVKDRAKKKAESAEKIKTVETLILENLIEKDTVSIKPCLLSEEDPLTLDDILNLWDGIRETSGRIMIMSSNHYNDLDPALKRPGRIDIELELSHTSRKTIGEIYEHLFDKPIAPDTLELVPDRVYTPAEIINVYTDVEHNADKFVEKLILRKNEKKMSDDIII
jgi:SpoVK/Ycf46/Vps4 family AAA+-type ATPase